MRNCMSRRILVRQNTCVAIVYGMISGFPFQIWDFDVFYLR